MSFEKCAVTLNLAGKIRPTEIREAAADYEQRGMPLSDAMIRAVEDKLNMAEMEERSIVKAVRDAYEAKGGKVSKPKVAINQVELSYPLALRGDWYGEGTFKENGGRLVYVSPDEYIAAVRPLTMDEESRENIDLLKDHIKDGKTLDPLLIRANGKEDGRHRAYAAKELGIKKVPVIAYGEWFKDAQKVSDEKFAGEDIQMSNRTIEVDGVRRPIENSEGRPVAQGFKEQQAFWRWFGDSKVVDSEGRPKVMYHGTASDINAFDKSKLGDNTRQEEGELGFFFTSKNMLADSYSEIAAKGGWANKTKAGDPSIYPVYLRIETPLKYSTASSFYKDADSYKGRLNDWRGELEQAGHDGVIVRDDFEEVITFNPNQIKSTIGNQGTFDPESDDIRMSRRQQAIQGQHFLLKGETWNEQKRRAIQDYFIRVKSVQDMIEAQGGVVGEKQDVYQAEELTYGRIQEQMREFKDKVVEPLLKDVQKADLTLPELAMYAYAKHAAERNAAMQAINPKLPAGTGSGMTNAEASAILAQFKADGKEQDLADLHARLMNITSTTRQLLLAEGLISRDEFTAWDSKYDNYVPLRGFVEDETDVVDGLDKKHGRGAGKGFNIRGAESTRALGRTSKAGHVIENILNDYERAVVRVERNDVAKVFLNLITSNPDASLWEIDAKRTTASLNKATQTVSYNQLIDKGEDTISVKLDGKEVYIKVNDPLLVRAMRQASSDETGQATRILMKSLGWYTALMRNVLTRFNPAFGFSNAVKDFGFGTVSVLADLGPKGVALFAKNYATSGGANVRNEFGKADMSKAVDRQYAEFRAAGATTGGYHMRDLQEMKKELQNLIVEYGGEPTTLAQKLIATKGIKQAYKASKTTLRMLELIGSLSENQARFAAFRAAREMGKTPAQAASIAKNLTTNFNRKGEWGSALNTLYLFFNAGVQGTDKMMKNLKSPHVQGAMAGMVGLTMGMALLAASVGGDDDDGQALWDKIPQFEKERNLIFMLPAEIEMDGATRVGKNGRYIKIPVQYGLNVFTNMGYTIADSLRYAHDKSQGVKPSRAAINTLSSVFGAFNPLGGSVDVSDPISMGMAVSPSVGDVMIQFGAGVDGFGRPTSPAKSPFDKKPDSENYGPAMIGTWEQRLAAWMNESTGGDAAVSGGIDLAPGTLRNVKRNLTGGTGDFLSSVFVNVPSKLMSPGAEIESRDIPVAKAFYGKVDNSTSLGLYYERKAMAELKAFEAKQRDKLDIEAKYTPEESMLQDLGTRSKYYTDQMLDLKKAEIEVMTDKNINEEKRNVEMLKIKSARGALSRAFNSEYMEIQKELAK